MFVTHLPSIRTTKSGGIGRTSLSNSRSAPHRLLGRISVAVNRSFHSGPSVGFSTYTPAPAAKLKGNGPRRVTLLMLTLTGTVHFSPPLASQFAIASVL